MKALAMLAALLPATAAAQDVAPPVRTMIATKGECTGLVVNSAPAACGDVALNMVYRDGQTSIMIKTGDGNLVSFYGTLDGKGGIAVTKVTMSRSGETPSVRSTPATGYCTAETLRKPRTHIECTADAPDGRRFAASFTGTEDEVTVSDMDR
ncbi:MAG: hypothetical protein KF730_02405 [Sphingomonas sp.]|uniref:hypothetical protein n=1 Tax=Sphingomonas sp. TaxID=28214 RepID=UPI0025FD4C1C|nr:hypothetical protein [Sphingomonas sp.]MBX3563407.1 hypothetical protein [Sphingomonas sp.]